MRKFNAAHSDPTLVEWYGDSTSSDGEFEGRTAAGQFHEVVDGRRDGLRGRSVSYVVVVRGGRVCIPYIAGGHVRTVVDGVP